MKFVINGTEYDVTRGMQRVSLHDLYTLKVTEGIGMKTIQGDLERMDKLESPMDLLEDPQMMKSFMGLIWILRRQAGEKVTLEEANSDFGLGELQMVRDDDEAVQDPKAPADSAAEESPATPE